MTKSTSVQLKGTLLNFGVLILFTWQKLFDLFAAGTVISIIFAIAYVCFFLSLAFWLCNMIIDLVLRVVSLSVKVLSKKKRIIHILCMIFVIVIYAIYYLGFAPVKRLSFVNIFIGSSILVSSAGILGSKNKEILNKKE